jgi:hypothetical protein
VHIHDSSAAIGTSLEPQLELASTVEKYLRGVQPRGLDALKRLLEKSNIEGACPER